MSGTAARVRTRRQLPTPGAGAVASVKGLLERPNAAFVIILGSAGLLVLLGLVMVLSASSVESYRDHGSSFWFWRKQVRFFALGLPVLFVCARLPVRAWRALAYPSLLVAGTLLALVQVAGSHSVNGNTNWIVVGGVQVQPSEAAKLALILWGADLLTRKHKLLTQWKHLLVPLVPVTGVVLLLVLWGNDLGTALVLIVILLALLFFAGAPFRLFGLVLGVGGGLAGLLAATNANRVGRISAWLDPSSDVAQVNYQPLHGRYALGTGGWFGVGLGASREKWGNLPEAQNDFIFAIIGEELGLLGTISVLLLYTALCYGGYRVALRSTGRFEQLAAAGVTTWLGFQTLVNIGAVVGLMPVIGIPLPLVSAGGSALLTTLAAIGLLLSLARAQAKEERAARAVLPLPEPVAVRVPEQVGR
ncbi:cell division-specific peptidoglycan biosynthesis regulator FtsW [Motilibacter rhizosphaerae]|uniref:Probable peptidoglycan glycosyltransferase FtsW n=1 Tax=Motilibacter rhizosphaerae TaxID=598652 RepID=A0A4Q7NG59_9ACTN|nr:putative lipid II flippase FtsW [Motilibacter rhizosphaerae]RZS82917.1 cell division-specific peptidoglycan biosynthesis regulator FtsW [Motilibacter rhizosphaerae]